VERAVFLDRDGTLIRDRGYLADPDGVELLPGVMTALAALRDRRLRLVVVSNQSGIARGMITRVQHLSVDARFRGLVLAGGVALDGVYYCEHGPDDGCACRKPNDGMLRAASRDLGIDLSKSMLVGDKPSDVAAGRAAGCVTALLRASGDADFVGAEWSGLLPNILAWVG